MTKIYLMVADEQDIKPDGQFKKAKGVELTQDWLEFATSHLEHWFPQDKELAKVRKVLKCLTKQ